MKWELKHSYAMAALINFISFGLNLFVATREHTLYIVLALINYVIGVAFLILWVIAYDKLKNHEYDNFLNEK